MKEKTAISLFVLALLILGVGLFNEFKRPSKVKANSRSYMELQAAYYQGVYDANHNQVEEN